MFLGDILYMSYKQLRKTIISNYRFLDNPCDAKQSYM